MAAVAIWIITFATGQARPTINALRTHPRALITLSGGAVAGPFLGVWLSLIAVQRAPLGIAATLTSLAPVILLPLGKIFFQERIGVQAIAGTAAAVAGTVVLFL